MPHPFSVQTVTINSGFAVSSGFSTAHDAAIGIVVPALDSCSLHIQAADGIGGTYNRLLTATGDAEYAAAVGSGSVMLTLPEIAKPWAALAIETSSGQSDDVFFRVVTKP